MGLIFDKETGELVLKIDAKQGKVLLEVFSILEEYGMLRRDMAELYDNLKRQIPQ